MSASLRVIGRMILFVWTVAGGLPAGAGIISERPLQITSLLVDSGGTATIYVADRAGNSVHRGLLYRGWLHEPYPKISRLKKAKVDRPTDLAAFDGKVFVLDRDGSRLQRIDSLGRTEEIRCVPPLSGVTQIAASSTGLLVAATRRTEGAVSLDLFEFRGKELLPLSTLRELPFRQVVNMGFYGDELFVLDGTTIHSTILPFNSPSGSRGLTEVKWRPYPLNGDFRNFAFYGGVFYLVGERPAAYIRAIGQVVPLSASMLPRADHIAVTRTELVFATREQRLEHWTRPVPVTVEMELTAAATDEIATKLYGYLLANGLLASSTVESASAQTLNDLLIAERRLLGGVNPASSTGSTLSQVICALNTCSSTDGLTTEVPNGSRWSLPAVSIETSIALEMTDAWSRSIDEILLERFPVKADREGISHEYLAKINKIDSSQWPEGARSPTQYLLIPRKKWRLSTVVLSKDLESGDALRFMDIPGVRIVSLEEAPVKGMCDAVPLPNGTGWAELKIRRENLCKRIDCVAPPNGGLTLPVIAIAEGAVDKTHPAFFDSAGATAWHRAEQFNIVPDTTACARVAPVLREALNSTGSKDHGTYIAGIVGARSSAAVPGLLDNVKLYHFDIENISPSLLINQIETANTAGVPIINFSNSIDLPQEQLQSVRQEIESSPALFVVAAGNEGQKVDSVTMKPLAQFGNAANVLVVGASNDCDDVLGDTVRSGKRLFGSNFGSLVHLVAPGDRIGGPAEQGAYIEGTGSSSSTAIVSAAAAVLVAENNVASAANIKARLIYTADWYRQYQDKVVGGRLNMRHAVWTATNHLLKVQSIPGKLFRVNLNFSANPQIRIGPNQFVAMKNVLRMLHLQDGTFRLIRIGAGNRLEIAGPIAIDFSQSQRIPCTAEEWVEGTGFAETPDSRTVCRNGGLEPRQIDDFIAKKPEAVTF